MSYFRALQRRNVFRAIAAYIVIGWILLQVSSTLEDALKLPDWFDAVVTALLVLGFPVGLVFSSRLRVTAQLIKAEDGFHLWSETYDRADGDTLSYRTKSPVMSPAHCSRKSSAVRDRRNPREDETSKRRTCT